MKRDSFVYCALLLILYSCAPKISFTALPTTITKGDSIILNWNVKGKPTLLFDQKKIAHPPRDSLDILEFTLSVQRGKKVQYIKRQISVLPKESSDRVVMLTNDIKGDTLIATGIKDTTVWAGFEIISVSSLSSRPLTIVHANKTAELNNPELPSQVWKGSPYGGAWKILTVLTEAEKKDHSIIPGQLEIKALIRPQKK